MKTKKCSKCNTEKDINLFQKKSHNKDGYNGKCKECLKKYRIDNIEKYKISNKKWTIKNKKRLSEYRKEYAKKNKYKIKLQKQKYNKESYEVRRSYVHRNRKKIRDYNNHLYKKDMKFISDRYIKRGLVNQGFSRKEITKEIIEIKRLQIQIYREIKNQ